MRIHFLPHHFASALFDLVAAGCAFIGAYLTIFGPFELLNINNLLIKLISFISISSIVFLILKPYRGSWRYVSIPDIKIIVLSACGIIIIFISVTFLITRGEDISRSVLVLSFIYLIFFMAGARLSYRILSERIIHFPHFLNTEVYSNAVLIFGASYKAESFIRNTRRETGCRFSVVGIIDDSRANLGRTIQGVRVMGDLRMLDAVLEKLNRRGLKINEMVIAESSLTKDRLREIFECANSLSLKVSRIPDLIEIAGLNSNLLIEPKPIELEDLLERPEVKRNTSNIVGLIEGKVILVTGAGGSIGSELSRQIATFGPRRLIITDHSEFHLYKVDKELRERHPDSEIISWVVDVRDKARISHAFARFAPDAVFHAAALKHVPLMEENPLEAVKTNVLGTRNVADAALMHEATTFVMISTDKAVNPTSIMGVTKRAAEAYCQALDLMSRRTRFKTVRFGNVLGSNGSVVPRFQEQIAAGGPVTVTHPEIVRYFMTIPEAVSLILQASSHTLDREDGRGKIMVLDMGKPVRVADLAARLIQLAGYRPSIDIDIIFTGLRPGEKLYEELFHANEECEPQTDEGYVIASPRAVDRNLTLKTIQDIENCLSNGDDEYAIKLLLDIVPEYNGKKY